MSMRSVSTSNKQRIRLPLKQSLFLASRYAGLRLGEQVRSFLPIVLYMAGFQIFVLRQNISNTLWIILGIAGAIIGLAFFMEGLYLTIMPLGEEIGSKLPMRWPIAAILFFALLLGTAATIAEPAIGVLRAAGSGLDPKKSPLLHYLLGRGSSWLVLSIALGVGFAVMVGMLRILKALTLKKILIFSVPPTLLLTIISGLHPLISPLVSLAWDSGGITTGPVTVPLVLALGLGVSRMASRDENDDGGFGMVTLASLFPVVSVLALGWILVLGPFAGHSPDSLAKHLAQSQALENTQENTQTAHSDVEYVAPSLKKELSNALVAIVPLALFLLLVSRILLGERIRFADEKLLGIFFACAGMTLFTIGIQSGLAALGVQVGKTLPASFQTIELPDQSIILNNVQSSDIIPLFSQDGKKRQVLFFSSENIATGSANIIEYNETRHDEQTGTYRHTPSIGPLMSQPWAGFVLILVFGFAMGYGATLAEPALSALSKTVEEVSVGAISRKRLTHTVALGVGAGLVLGLSRILWDLPMHWILPGIYCVIMILTLVSKDDFVSIAWDSAGVTTGPVTVPLVIVIGLSLGTRVGIQEGFGVLASASALPILLVLVLGLVTRRSQ